MASWDLPSSEEEAERDGRIALGVAIVLTAVFVVLLSISLVVGISKASASGGPDRTLAVRTADETTYQGRGVRWWARHAVQNRKNSNARGLTIRRLQATVRTRHVLPTGHWLDGAFLCIHSHERGTAGWQTNTGNGYHGGLQMDRAFMRSYGAWALEAFGPAERWPASVQIAVAIRAWLSRGFGPWPATRRMCGL